MIKDSGNRTEFESGAVRDIQKGKGRCDLLPLDVVSHWLNKDDGGDSVLLAISSFMKYSNTDFLEMALTFFQIKLSWHQSTLLLEVSKHFEEGAEKYGENNWKKGLPINCYINSAVRHYLKWLRGDKDEPHDRAFVWNIMCAIWTCNNKPELNNFTTRKGENNASN